MVFVCGSVYAVNYVYRLAYVEPALHPRDEAYLIMVDKLFDVLLQSVCQFFIEYFCIYFHRVYWPAFFFSCWVSTGFWYQDDVGLIKWFGKDSLFLDCFRKNGTSSSLYVWYNLAVNPSVAVLFLCGRLLIVASTSAFVIGLFRVSTSSWFRLGRMQVSRNFPLNTVFAVSQFLLFSLCS